MDEFLNEIQEKKFKIYLQPKFDTKTEKIVGAEALVRKQAGKEIILPNEFIPLYEKMGWITILDRYILKEVCKLQKKWREENLPLFPISINESKLHLKNPNYAKELEEILRKEEADPRLIELEMTETSIVEDISLAKEVAELVRRLGFIISLDDFGTGYSAFNVLKDIEIDVLKIDKTFFDELEKNKRAQIIIESIIKMCKQLEIKTVAEGIERKEQVNFLKRIHCDSIQGYYFSKPIPVKEFEEIYLFKNRKKNRKNKKNS